MVTAWQEMHTPPYEQDYLNANNLYNLDKNTSLFVKKFLNKSCFSHYKNPNRIQKSSIIATKGLSHLKYKSIMPDTKNNIIDACVPKNKFSTNIFMHNGFAIARIPKCDIDHTYLILKYNTPFRKLLKRPQIIETQKIFLDNNSFSDSNYYYILYTQLKSIEYIETLIK